jgi:DNA-binding MarR family transcriptional regulator
MPKLTDTQLVVLSAAANRADLSILPLPRNLKGGAAAKLVDGLIRRGLAERVKSDRRAVPDLIRVTRAGLDVIGVEAEEPLPAEEPPAKSKRKAGKAHKGGGKTKARRPRDDTKQAQLIGMLRRPKGATVPEIAEAFGWQPHTVRGAIAGALKKKLGLDVVSEKVEGRGRVYRIAG